MREISNDLIKTEVVEQKYIYSAKEIWELYNVSKRTWDRFVAGFLSKTGFTQKADYLEKHPSRSGGNKYTEKTLKTFQAWLMRNKANQGNNSSIVKEIVKSAVKNEENWYSVKEICDICNTSRQTWINFKNDSNCKASFTVKRNLKEGDKNVDYYSEDILKLFQAWLLRNQANQGRASDTIKSIVKSAGDWLSKKELASMCKVDEKTIQRIANDILILDTGVQNQSHIKKEETI